MMIPARGVRPTATVILATALLLCLPAPAHAYIGPGAGFAVISSFLVTLVTGLLALLSLAAWPFRLVWRRIRRGRRPLPPTGRLIVIGLSGQDPDATERLVQRGELPNFRALAAQGQCTRFVVPAFVSTPEIWSAFATGTERREGRPPFWSVMGHHGVWSIIHFVPFPLHRFRGVQLNTTGASYPRLYARYLSSRIEAPAHLRRDDDDHVRQAMFFAALDRLREGALVAVFARTGGSEGTCTHNDAFVGEVLSRLRPDDTLIALSDRGVCFSSRPILVSNPTILDFAPTILRLFGIDPPGAMTGRLLFATESSHEVAA